MLKQAHPDTAVMGENPEQRLPPHDPEANDSDSENIGEAKKSASNDPFGSEDVAEVKYRTMTWWYVLHPNLLTKTVVSS